MLFPFGTQGSTAPRIPPATTAEMDPRPVLRGMCPVAVDALPGSLVMLTRRLPDSVVRIAVPGWTVLPHMQPPGYTHACLEFPRQVYLEQWPAEPVRDIPFHHGPGPRTPPLPEEDDEEPPVPKAPVPSPCSTILLSSDDDPDDDDTFAILGA